MCNDRVVSEGLRKMSQAGRAKSWEGLRGLDNEFGEVNVVHTAIGEGCWWGGGLG